MAKVFETVAEQGMIRLPADVPAKTHCLVTVLDDDLEALREQAQQVLSEAKQQRMSHLLERQREGGLERDEIKELGRPCRRI